MQFWQRFGLLLAFFATVFIIRNTWLQKYFNDGTNSKQNSKELEKKKAELKEKLTLLSERINHVKVSQIASRFVSKQRKDISKDILNFGEQKKCKNLNLMVMITSHVKNTERRNAIRQSYLDSSKWGAYLKTRGVAVEYFFLVGNQVENKDGTASDYTPPVRLESKENKDLIAIDIVESFYSLSYKLMIGFQWMDEQCTFDYLLKLDDDMAVNIHAIVNLIKDADTPKENLYAGNLFQASQTSVLRTGRYGITREEWPRENYPDYCSGGGFLMTPDVVNQIIPYYNWVNPLKIDDAYIGSLVCKAGLDATMSKQFHMLDHDCMFNKTAVIFHYNGEKKDKTICIEKFNQESLKLAQSYLSTELL